MGKTYTDRRDHNDLNEAVATSRVYGGYVTPGAAVNVNVAALLGTVYDSSAQPNPQDIESAGATNLAVTAGGAAGQSVRNNIVIDSTGAISAVAGTSATTGTQVAPAVAAGTTLLATVDVPNGAVAVTQPNINNKIRNWI